MTTTHPAWQFVIDRARLPGTARHEAGHVVIAAALGWPVRGATIVPQLDGGRTWSGQAGVLLTRFASVSPEHFAKQVIAAYVAGVAAEGVAREPNCSHRAADAAWSILDGGGHNSAAGDRAMVRQWAAKVHVDEGTGVMLTRRLLLQTCCVLGRKPAAFAVDAIAGGLLRAGTLDGPAVGGLVALAERTHGPIGAVLPAGYF